MADDQDRLQQLVRSVFAQAMMPSSVDGNWFDRTFYAVFKTTSPNRVNEFRQLVGFVCSNMLGPGEVQPVGRYPMGEMRAGAPQGVGGFSQETVPVGVPQVDAPPVQPRGPLPGQLPDGMYFDSLFGAPVLSHIGDPKRKAVGEQFSALGEAGEHIVGGGLDAAAVGSVAGVPLGPAGVATGATVGFIAGAGEAALDIVEDKLVTPIMDGVKNVLGGLF